MKRDEIYYKAMLARDHRFDGKFFVGVKTTGIYCRPICPAKPKRENVEFFPNHLAAEKAGYRPCLRCRPESAPQSPAWVGKSSVVQRAIKMLHDLETLELNEEKFADRFGVSARHLRRLFIEEVGKTPKQLSAENRLNLARKLIVETSLPMTEISSASGFQSVRRFNDAFKDRFKRTPSEIRRSPLENRSGVKISIPYRPPFDFEGLLHFYRSHSVGNLEWFTPGKMHRVVTFGGKVGQIAISNDPEKSQVFVEIDFPEASAIHSIITRVRALLDLDSDPVMIANSLESDPKVRSISKKHPGIRLPSGWEPFEVAIATILGQLVSVERGRALVGDLIEMAGSDSGLVIDGKKIKFFPTPKQILTADLTALKTTNARRQTMIAFSQAIVDKTLSLEPSQDVGEFIKKVSAIRGIGPWSANYMSLKVLRHTDAFPATDLILARALEIHPEEVIEKFSPWRGYAAILFWKEYHHALTKTKGVRK